MLPGVTAALGAAADALMPLTMRGFNKAVVLATGHAAGLDDDLDWSALARAGQPIVVYMGLRNAGSIAERLIAGGLSPETPAAVVMSATTAAERVLVATLGTLAQRIAAEGFASPALLVIGDIVRLRGALTEAPA